VSEGALVLCLDGSTETCSVALVEMRGVAAAELESRATDDSRAHARLLLPLADEALRTRGVSPKDLSAVVVGTGPGTFTGVRIAVATARALALALAIPIIGVSTLRALAAEAAREMAEPSSSAAARPQVLIPVVEAKRGQLFYQVFERSADASGTGDGWRPVSQPGACEIGRFPGEVVARYKYALVVGSVARLKESDPDQLEAATRWELRETAVKAAWLVLGQEKLVDESPAAILSRRARQGTRARVKEAPFHLEGSPEAVVPIYVRPPDADVHITKMRDPWGSAGVTGGGTPD
jgi:tRNA threonylcarbamoyl adenosine modification protein YeaZ